MTFRFWTFLKMSIFQNLPDFLFEIVELYILLKKELKETGGPKIIYISKLLKEFLFQYITQLLLADMFILVEIVYCNKNRLLLHYKSIY